MKKLSIYITTLCLLVLAACSKDAASDSISTTGQGGSLARFTIAEDHLYVVDDKKLYAYSLANAQKPLLKSTQSVGIDVETIYTYKDKLFIGSQDAMYVYSISDAARPSKLGVASHVRSCDPVIANDSIAYVTVRGGSTCGGSLNALIVYNVKDVLNPVQLNMVNMANPYGLGMNDARLFVCDGSSGLKVYDISADPIQPKFLKTYTGEAFYDVIVYDDLLLCMIDGGTILYSIDANNELTFLSKVTQ